MSNDKSATLGIIKEHKEDIDWILTKQAELRAELMAFYKKDLKEIQSALSSLGDADSSAEFAKQAVKDVQEHFIKQWGRSYDIITPSDAALSEH